MGAWVVAVLDVASRRAFRPADHVGELGCRHPLSGIAVCVFNGLADIGHFVEGGAAAETIDAL